MITSDEYIAEIPAPVIRDALLSMLADIKNLQIHVEQLQSDLSNIEQQLGIIHDTSN